jgi:hypothetical protein
VPAIGERLAAEIYERMVSLWTLSQLGPNEFQHKEQGID